MKKVMVFLLLCFCWAKANAQDVQVYFSPNGGCQDAVVSAMNQANESIDIAMYYLSSAPIAHAIVRAKLRDVRIRLVLDQGQEIESASKSGYLIGHGLEVRYHLGFGLMHNKFAIIDRKYLITGSFNWTQTAQERNEENMLILQDQAVISQYQQRFEYLWNTSRIDSRDARGFDAFPAWFCANFHLFCST